jgi:hypothetical protein
MRRANAKRAVDVVRSRRGRGHVEAKALHVSRIAGALIDVVAAIDGTQEVARGRPSRSELCQLLKDVS